MEHLELYETLRLYKFVDLDEWTQSVSPPDRPTSADNFGQEDTGEDLMSSREWSQMQISERQALYDACNEERVAMKDRTLLETNHLQLSDRLAVALRKCLRLTSFTNTPTVAAIALQHVSI